MRVGYFTIHILLDGDRTCNDMFFEFSYEKYNIYTTVQYFNVLNLILRVILLIYGGVISWMRRVLVSVRMINLSELYLY